VKIFNFRPKHPGAFSFKTRISNLGIDSDDPDELEDLLDDADEAGELDENDPENDGSEGDDDEDDGEVVDLLVYSVVGDPASLDPSDETNVTARAIATALRSAPNAKRINVHLNSEGGNVADALAIYNSLTAHKAQLAPYQNLNHQIFFAVIRRRHTKCWLQTSTATRRWSKACVASRLPKNLRTSTG
jgi:hypothetical protein